MSLSCTIMYNNIGTSSRSSRLLNRGLTTTHTHNHSIDVADALRFRPISDETKCKYYDLFNQGHSPSIADLEYETNLMYQHNPHF